MLRIGTGEVWQWRHGRMRPVFAEEAAAGAGVDTLLSGRRASIAVGLGGSGDPECTEMVCAVEPGDRFLLLATRRLMSLDQALLAQALSLADGDDARAHLAHVVGAGHRSFAVASGRHRDRTMTNRFVSAALSVTGKVRRHNEDAILVRDEVGLWVVADGMGGHSAGDYASALIVERLGALSRSGSVFDFIEASRTHWSRSMRT